MDTEYTSKIGFLELLSIKMQFETYSKKKQKNVSNTLNQKVLIQLILNGKWNDYPSITNLLCLGKRNKKRY